MVTGTIAAEPPVPASAEPPPAAGLFPPPATALLDEPPPELQAARVAPAAQHAITIAIRAAGRLRACLTLALSFNSLTVLSCFGFGLSRCATGRCAVRRAAAGRS